MPALSVGERDSVAYEDIGRGPLVVLIHGSPGSARVWQPVTEQLAPPRGRRWGCRATAGTRCG